MTNKKQLCVVFALSLAGCAGEVSPGDEDNVLAEFPSVTASPAPAGIRQTDWDAESVDDETRSHAPVDRQPRLRPARRARRRAVARPPSRSSAPPTAARRGTRASSTPTSRAPTTAARCDVAVGGSTALLVLSGATWASHFYDPDTGLNYKGQKSPTAYDQALAHLDNARAQLAEATARRLLRARPVAALLHRPHAADARVELHGQELAARAALRLRELRRWRSRRATSPPGAGPTQRRRRGAAHRRRARVQAALAGRCKAAIAAATPRAAAASSPATGLDHTELLAERRRRRQRSSASSCARRRRRRRATSRRRPALACASLADDADELRQRPGQLVDADARHRRHHVLVALLPPAHRPARRGSRRRGRLPRRRCARAGDRRAAPSRPADAGSPRRARAATDPRPAPPRTPSSRSRSRAWMNRY